MQLTFLQPLLTLSFSPSFCQCPFCPKVFVSNDYLLAHLQRRHAEQNSQLINSSSGQPAKESRQSRNSDTAINGELLQELKEIKERLASTERQLQQEKNGQRTEVALTCCFMLSR